MTHFLTWLKTYKWEVGAVVLITVLSLFLRLYHLAETLPFTYDQGRDMLTLADITHGDLKLVGPTTGIGGLFLGPFYFYFLLPGFVLFSGSPIGVAWWNAAIIALSLIFFYLLLRPMVGTKWALLGYVLLIIVPGALENARMIWNPSLTVSTLLISTWALFASKKHSWLLIVSLLFYGLCLQTELAYAVFLAPAYAVWVINYGPWRKKEHVYSWPTLLLASAAFGVTLLPQFVFELKNHFLMTRTLVTELGDASNTAPWKQVLATRPGFMFYELGRLLFANMWGTNEATVLVTSLGLTLALRNRKSAEERWWLACLVLPLLGMLLFRGHGGTFFNYYISAHYLPVIAVVVLALARFKQKIGARISLQSLLATGVFAVMGLGMWQYWPLIGRPEIFHYTIQRQIRAVSYILDKQTGRPQAWDVFVPNLWPTQYQYLYQWLSQRRGLSGAPWLITDQDPTYYLLSEPAAVGGSQLSYEDWHKRSTQSAHCAIDQEFGIIVVEKCER